MVIRETVEIAIGQCNEEKCYEAGMTYTMPPDQMKKLFEVSGTCSQKIQFHCKSAPLQVRKTIKLSYNKTVTTVTAIKAARNYLSLKKTNTFNCQNLSIITFT